MGTAGRCERHAVFLHAGASSVGSEPVSVPGLRPEFATVAESGPHRGGRGINLYGFVGNSPLNRGDPYGSKWALFDSQAWGQFFHDIFYGSNYQSPQWDPNSRMALANDAGVGVTQLRDPAGNVVQAGDLVQSTVLNAAANVAMLPLGGPEEEGAYAAADAALQAARAAKAARNCPKIDPNKLRHIFDNARHDLGSLLSQFKSKEEAFTAIQQATQAVVQQQKLTGVFETTVQVGGQTITVRGNVIHGVAQIGTAFK